MWLLALSILAALACGYLWIQAANRLIQTRRELSTADSKYQSISIERGRLQAQFGEIADNCGVGIIRVDKALQVAYANEVSRQLAGHDLEHKSIIQGLLSDELQVAARTAIDARTTQELELKDVGPEHRSILARVLPSSEPTEALVFLQDVSDVRHLEMVRRDFVANVSHELRTPLASIRAMAETLESAATDAKTSKRFLGMIISESERLTRIADDLLSLARVESVAPERQTFDLSEVLKAVAAQFAPRAKKERIHLDAEVPPGITVYANRDQIEEAVVNLMDNAFKYSSEDGKVRLLVSRVDDSIAISVSDSGIGILQEDIPRIFERFYRVDKARSRRTGGTGLGLSIVKHVAESHGGSVQVESEFNRGSTFTILIPDLQVA